MTTTEPHTTRHQCINASCGCNDGITAGSCSTWCEANTTEASDVERGKAALTSCDCSHEACRSGRGRGTPERGMA